MIHTVRAVRTLQAVAMSVGLALLLWGTGLPALFQVAEASQLTSASDTLSNSTPSQDSVHTIGFTTDNGLSIGDTIVISFPAGFDLSGLDGADISMTVNGNSTTTQEGAAGAGAWGVATGTPTAQDIQLTTPTDVGVASSSALVITIGDEVGTMITNPSATTSYAIDIGGSMQDSGSVRVAIIESVTVSASVNTTLEFAIHGVGASSTVNGSATSTIATSTNTTLPFGALSNGVSETLAQDLTIVTNAQNGYTVTVEESGPLQSSTGGVIDGFIDGDNTTNPASWQSPSADYSDDTTWGHWGLTSTDGTTTRSNQFSSDKWVAPSTTPIVVMGHTGPADGTTSGIGAARIGYQVEISPLQEAGDDYSTTLRYIATPTF